MYEFLCNNLLIICPNSYKKGILKYLSDNKMLLNIKFMTLSEYKKKIKFDYDIKTINYLVKKGLKVENAITFINNLYYIEEKEYNNEKLDYLVSLKKELDDNNLLIHDSLFNKMLQRYKIIIYGYGKLDQYTLSLFNNYELIDYDKKDKFFDVYKVSSISDEVEMVFQKISDLLTKGVDINKIFLMNLDSEYYPIIKRYSIYYSIPVSLTSDDSLMGTELGKTFYEMVLDNKTKEEIFEYLMKYADNKKAITLINLLNKYTELDLNDTKEQIKYELENTKIESELFENTVGVKKIFDNVLDDEYIFLLNFNMPTIPKLSLDTDYITDNIKDLVGLPSTIEENNLVKENTLNYLSNINHLIISYKELSPFNKYYPSILLDDIKYHELTYNRSLNYSILANRVLYTMYLDDLVKYGIYNKNLDLLYSNYGTNNYLDYDNSFSGINSDSLKDFLNNQLTLSYSSIDNYYKCGFKYYLTNILKVNLYEESFMTIVGNLFHDVLSHMNDDDFNLDEHYNKFLENRDFNEKEKFFLDKLKHDLIDIVEVIKKHQFITGFSKMLYEQEIDITLQNSPYIHFKGYVDKIMYKEKDDDTLVSIIDYKTYTPDINIKNLEFGLSMQLPIYLYLVKNSELFKNVKFTGFYLQYILNNNFKKDKKTIIEQKLDNMKLVGYSTSDIERLSIFDSTYEDSEMIRSMKLNKDGSFSHYAKVLSDEEIDEILKLTKEKINEAIELILKGDFAINPKIVNRENVSCEYCKYQDICYLSEKNKVYLRSGGEMDESNSGTEISD